MFRCDSSSESQYLKPDKTRVTKTLRLNCLYLLKRQVIFCYWMHTFLTMLVTIIPIDLDEHSFLVSTGSMREISIKVTLHVDTCSVNHPNILNFSFSSIVSTKTSRINLLLSKRFPYSK